MRYFTLVVFSSFLFILSAEPATSNAPAQINPPQSTVSAPQKEGIQLAQRGRCRAFAKTNNCRVAWDRRSKSCVCVGV
jgi:hypothetical protein